MIREISARATVDAAAHTGVKDKLAQIFKSFCTHQQPQLLQKTHDIEEWVLCLAATIMSDVIGTGQDSDF